jgi:fatty-acyl-CoA synthase
MLGYYQDPEHTAKVIDPDGWLHTGDMAIRQPDGYFRITGRLKDIIIRGGENISPREIEELLYRHPAVEDVQVVGVPDRRFGEQVLACIHRRAGANVNEEDIRDYCKGQLAHFKTPHYVWFVDHFPTTVTGKIQKFKLRQQAIRHFHLDDDASIQTA